MKYNLSEIMKKAHAIRAEGNRRFRPSMSTALKIAWANAKMARRPPMPAADRLFLLQMKDRWDSSDYILAEKLKEQIREEAA